MFVKMVCKKCGELPFQLPMAKEVVADETKFSYLEQELLKGAKCKKCGSLITLQRGELKSKEAIEIYNELKDRIQEVGKHIDFDSFIITSNTQVINRMMQEVEKISSLYFYKNILFFALVGENAPDGTITFRTQTFYSGVYTIFPEIRKVLLEDSINRIRNEHGGNFKFNDYKVNEFLNMNKKNSELQKEIENLKQMIKMQDEMNKKFENNFNNELREKTIELEHFKKLYGDLKNKTIQR